MKYFMLAFILFFLPMIAGAVTVYECEDSEGNRSFYDRCPPGTTPVEEKKLRGGKKTSAPVVTLYIVPECGACTKVRNYLQARNISFEEKDVKDNAELQKELNDKAGALKVPSLVVDDSVITGFDESAMEQVFEKSE